VAWIMGALAIVVFAFACLAQLAIGFVLDHNPILNVLAGVLAMKILGFVEIVGQLGVQSSLLAFVFMLGCSRTRRSTIS